MPLSSKLYSCSTRTENILAYHPDVTTTCTRSSLGPSETGIHYHNKLSNFVLLRLLNKPSLLLEVNSGYWVGSSDPTQRSWTMFLTCTCTCTCTTVPSRSLYQAALHFHWVGWHCNCVILMLRSFHPIEVVGITTKKRRRAGRLEGDCADWAMRTISAVSRGRVVSASTRNLLVWRMYAGREASFSFMKELYCRFVRRLISRKRRSVILEVVWSDSLSWWDGRWSANRVVTVVSVASSWLFWRQQPSGGECELSYPSMVLPSQDSDRGSFVFSVKRWLDSARVNAEVMFISLSNQK